jgi:hypothetical protein
VNHLINLQRFIRDLLDYDENLIERGRRNFEQADFETDYIVVDGIGAARALTRSERFDDVDEQMHYIRRFAKPCTIDFYGTGAFTNADDFVTLLGSQESKELQESLGITVGSVSSVTDVKQLTGQQYGERLQVEIVMQYNVVKTVSTLRIDDAQLEFITN